MGLGGTLVTLQELVQKLLDEAEGHELSSTGLIANSMRTVEGAIERILQDMQLRGTLLKRWNPKTEMLVYKLPDTITEKASLEES